MASSYTRYHGGAHMCRQTLIHVNKTKRNHPIADLTRCRPQWCRYLINKHDKAQEPFWGVDGLERWLSGSEHCCSSRGRGFDFQHPHVWLTTVFNYSSRGSVILMWPLKALAGIGCTDTKWSTLSVLVVSVTVIKYSDINNLSEKRFIVAHSLRFSPLRQEVHGSRSLEQPVEFRLW